MIILKHPNTRIIIQCWTKKKNLNLGRGGMKKYMEQNMGGLVCLAIVCKNQTKR